MSISKEQPKPDDVLFSYKDFQYTRRMYESDFENDGSLRDIWWLGEPSELVRRFFLALESLDYEWTVDGLDNPTVEQYEALLPELGTVAIKIKTSSEIQLNAWGFGPPHGDMEADVHPSEVNESNCHDVFEFMRNVGSHLSTNVFIGGENTREKHPPIDPERGAFILYDAAKDSFERLDPPMTPFRNLQEQKMKIIDVTVTLFAWDDIPLTNYSPKSGRFSGTSQMGLVTISTDEGVHGHSLLGSASQGAHIDASTLISQLKPLLVGKDPLQREELWQDCMLAVRRTTIRAVGAIDVALWDLGGKIAGLPIYKMLGAYRNTITAYASSPVYPTPEEYVEEAQKLKDAGWTAYKIHPPTFPDQDIAVCEAVRKNLGDEHVLMLDSTWSYQYPDALRVGRAIEEMDYLWYEDPLADDDLYNYVKLRQKLEIPILATEYSPGNFTAYGPWITERATDYLRGDVAVKGGITAIYKTAHLAEAFHMNYEVHHGGNSLNNVANLHVIMAIKNTTMFEVILPDNAQKYGLIQDVEVDKSGNVSISQFDKPGLGAEIDFDLIERKKISVVS